MVGIVVVSHSRALARAAVALAEECCTARHCGSRSPRGSDERTFGTDAVQIVAAIEEADDGEGVVVLMDLGSAVLSAEFALDLLDDDLRSRVLLCPAPLVEGLVVAAVAASGGAGRRGGGGRGVGRAGGQAVASGHRHREPRARRTGHQRRRRGRHLRCHQRSRAARTTGGPTGAGGAHPRRHGVAAQPHRRDRSCSGVQLVPRRHALRAPRARGRDLGVREPGPRGTRPCPRAGPTRVRRAGRRRTASLRRPQRSSAARAFGRNGGRRRRPRAVGVAGVAVGPLFPDGQGSSGRARRADRRPCRRLAPAARSGGQGPTRHPAAARPHRPRDRRVRRGDLRRPPPAARRQRPARRRTSAARRGPGSRAGVGSGGRPGGG